VRERDNSNLKLPVLSASASLVLIVLAMVMLRFIVVGWQSVIANGNSNAGDQGATLQLGLDLAEKGVLSDGTRHPLYPLLLLPFAQRSWSYFTWAKLISLACGGAAIVLLFLLGRQIAGREAALLAALALSWNAEFVYHSATALGESLLVLIFWVGWYCLYCAVAQKGGYRCWALVGLCSGLAYLVKGTGNFLLLAGIVAILLTHKPNPHRMIASGLVLGAVFALVTAPLLVFNYRVFGSPFYNFATTHAMWLDKWRQSWVEDVSTLPTVVTYFATHTPSQVLERLLRGLAQLWQPFWRTVAPFTFDLQQSLSRLLGNPQWALWAMVVLGGALLIAAKSHLRTYLRTHSRMLTIVFVLFATVYLTFAWYADIVIGARFFLLLAPIASLLAMQALWFGYERLLLLIGSLFVPGASKLRIGNCDAETTHSGFIAARFAPMTLVAILIWLVVNTWPQMGMLEDPFEADRRHNQDAEHVLHWLTVGEPSGARVLWGPGHSLPTWKYSDRLEFRILPVTVKTLPEALAYPTIIAADYVILDAQMVARNKSLFRDYFDYESGRLALRQPFPDWSLTYVYKIYPADWCVFVPQDQGRMHPFPEVESDQRLRWLGYRLVNPSALPGETLSIWLEWQLVAATDHDYTVFVHLVQDGTLRGQIDRPPLFGRWPSSRWLPGMRIMDRFDLPIPPDAPPGRYQLHLGVYDAANGQRFRMTSAGYPTPNNAYAIDGITVFNISPS
jgi:4-amino-4-deoxy-L-arabinose transferase-like glycosyltransferase